MTVASSDTRVISINAHLREDPQEGQETLRENVRELLSQGKSVRDIASALGISKSKAGRIVFSLKQNTEESS